MAYDLDNIQLGKLLKTSPKASNTLCTRLPRRGRTRTRVEDSEPGCPPSIKFYVQLQLINTEDESIADDTQVVANLGYLQFAARDVPTSDRD